MQGLRCNRANATEPERTPNLAILATESGTKSGYAEPRHVLAAACGVAAKATMIAAGSLMASRKRIALIAHDNRKSDLLDWARFNRDTLAEHELYATGTTGALLADELDIPVNRVLSGPLGGDQQVGAAIAEGRVDFVIFFWDPLEPHPHDVDVKALLRIAVVYNVPIACNRATADFVLSSPLMAEDYRPTVADP